jgi:hypothetical protein
VRKYSKRKIAATIAITAILVGGGGAAAIAYWTGSGIGSGTAATGTSVAIVANQTSTVTNLVPGGAAQALSGNFTNSTGAPVLVNTVTASIASITQAVGTVGGCTSADYTLTGAAMAVGVNVATGTGGSWSGATIQFKNNTLANQDGCKGATVNLAYAIS